MNLIGGISDLSASMTSVTKALKTSSDNIANAETPNYIAKQGNFVSKETFTPRGNLISGGVAYQVQDISNMAISASQSLAKAFGDKIAKDIQDASFTRYSPQLNTMELTEKFANAANPQNPESSIVDLQANIKDQILEFRRVGKSIDFGILEFQRLSEEKAEVANNIYAEYQRLGAANPNDPRVRQLEHAYAEIAGWPPVPKANLDTAQGGELQGMRDTINALKASKQNLQDTYVKFSQDVNFSFVNPVLSDSMYDNVDLQGQRPQGIPEFSLQNYNVALGVQQSNNSMQRNYSNEEYTIQKASFDKQYGVNMEQEITKTSQLQRQYEALVKLVQTHDQMMQATINMKT